MNKDPAIERMIAVNELTEILCGKPCDICKFYGQNPKCMPLYNAEKIVDAGWRKVSDVASDIFEDLDSLMLDGEIGGKYPAKVINPVKYNELKEKHGGIE